MALAMMALDVFLLFLPNVNVALWTRNWLQSPRLLLGGGRDQIVPWIALCCWPEVYDDGIFHWGR